MTPPNELLPAAAPPRTEPGETIAIDLPEFLHRLSTNLRAAESRSAAHKRRRRPVLALRARRKGARARRLIVQQALEAVASGEWELTRGATSAAVTPAAVEAATPPPPVTLRTSEVAWPVVNHALLARISAYNVTSEPVGDR